MCGASHAAYGFLVSGRASSAAAALTVALSATATLSSPAEEREAGLRLAFFGDSGTGNADQKAVARQLRRFEKDLRHVFLLGDNVYWSGRSERFDAAFHRIYGPLLRNVDADRTPRTRFHAALGNHDAKYCDLVRGPDGRLAPDRGAYAWQGPGCDVEEQLDDAAFGYPDGRRYYRVELRSVGGELLGEVFVIDTNTLPALNQPERHDPAQLEWLTQELTASRARGDTAGRQPWRIITMHRPLHTPSARGYVFGQGGHDPEWPLLDSLGRLLFGGEGEEGADPTLHDELDATLEGSGVDVIFAGHNHFYARMTPESDRIRHFVSGGGGIAVYEPDRSNGDVEAGGGFHHFVTVMLTRERFEYCVVDSLGRTRDHGSWAKSEREKDDVPLDSERRPIVLLLQTDLLGALEGDQQARHHGQIFASPLEVVLEHIEHDPAVALYRNHFGGGAGAEQSGDSGHRIEGSERSPRASLEFQISSPALDRALHDEQDHAGNLALFPECGARSKADRLHALGQLRKSVDAGALEGFGLPEYEQPPDEVQLLRIRADVARQRLEHPHEGFGMLPGLGDDQATHLLDRVEQDPGVLLEDLADRSDVELERHDVGLGDRADRVLGAGEEADPSDGGAGARVAHELAFQGHVNPAVDDEEDGFDRLGLFE